jgi:filamentous hemagglutinin
MKSLIMKNSIMKSVYNPRALITQARLAENPLRQWQRYIAVFMAYFFLLQLCLPTVAIAATMLSSEQFATVLKSPAYRATGKASGAIYARPNYLQLDTQSSMSIAGVYKALSPTKEPLPDTARIVGDEFVQQRLIRTQLSVLLGRTLIDTNGLLLNSDTKKAFELDQNDILFNAGVQFGNSTGKAFGTPLSAQESIANNMIWPEKRSINGAEVIIPVVYLNPATLATKPEGHQINLGLSALFNNIEINPGVVVSALGNENYTNVIGSLNNIVNAGTINGAGHLNLVAGNTFENLSGQIKANNNLDITTKRGDVINKTQVVSYQSKDGSGTRLSTIATLDSATGNIKITSGGGITYEGGVSNALFGALTFDAMGDIKLAPVATSSQSTTKDGHWTINSSSFELMQSKLTTKQLLSLMAGGSISITASELHSTEGGIELLAKHGIYIADEQGHFQSNRVDKIGKTQGTGSDFESFAIRSVLSAGKGILLETDAGAIELKGAKITSTEGTQVKATNGKVRLLVTKENSQHYLDTVRKGMWTIKTVHEEYLEETGIPNAIVGGLAVEALLGVDIEYAGREGATLAEQIAEYEKMPDTKWMADIYYGDTKFKDANGNMVALNTVVDFSQVELAYKYVREHNTNLSPAAMAIIAICVAVAMGPAGAGWIGTGTNGIGVAAGAAGQTLTLSASVMQAGALTLATSAAQNLLAGKSPAETLKAMTTDDALKNLAISMATAGALNQLGNMGAKLELFEETAGVTNAASLGNQAYQAVVNSVVTAGISVTINGGNSDDYLNAFKVSLATSAINSITKSLAQKIGAAAHLPEDQRIDVGVQYIAHAAVGCLRGTLTSKINGSDTESACYSGAGGAVIGEAVGKYYAGKLNRNLYDWVELQLKNSGESPSDEAQFAQFQLFQAQGADLAQLSAALVAFATVGDVDVASGAGMNAAQNNALFTAKTLETFKEMRDEVFNLFTPSKETFFGQMVLGAEESVVQWWNAPVHNIVSDNSATQEIDQLRLEAITYSETVEEKYRNKEISADDYQKQLYIAKQRLELVGIMRDFFPSTTGQYIVLSLEIGTGLLLGTKVSFRKGESNVEITTNGSERVSARPEWLQNLDRGTLFNFERRNAYTYREVYINKPGGGKTYYRLDGYDPIKGEIVSRKSTQFGDITENTGVAYINEVGAKYPVGATIANVPSNVKNGLAGGTLKGQLILEVPVQVKPIPLKVLNAAQNAGVSIRDINGKVY